MHQLSDAAKKKIANKAKAILLKQKVDFLSLPREMRDLIYHEYAESYPTLKDVVHCCTASPEGETCFLCNAIPKSAPYTSTIETRARTNYGMLLVSKQCSKEFLKTMALKNHIRHVFHVSLDRCDFLFQYCDNLDLSTLSYRCKIIVDYDILPDVIQVGQLQIYKGIAQRLPKFAASIPGVRNVEIVHANRYIERKMYAEGQNWPVVLSEDAIKGESHIDEWICVMYRALSVYPPQYSTNAPPDIERRRLTLEAFLVLRSLNVLDSISTIRSVNIRVWDAKCGVEHRFKKEAIGKDFEHVPRGERIVQHHVPRVLRKANDGYLFLRWYC